MWVGILWDTTKKVVQVEGFYFDADVSEQSDRKPVVFLSSLVTVWSQRFTLEMGNDFQIFE